MRLLGVLSAALMMFSVCMATAQQNEFIERTYSGVSKESNPQIAKRNIQDEAAQKVSEEIIKELIGNERFLKNKSLIEKKIIKNSARFIPFSKPSTPELQGDTYQMSVVLKLSLKDLKQLLQDNSLLNQNEAIPVVLPLISWVDRVEGRSYRWWLPGDKTSQNFLIKEGRLLETALRSAFQKYNFYLIKPMEAGLALHIPSDFQSEKISGDSAHFFSNYFNAPLIVDGQVLLNEADNNNFRIELRLTASQVSNGRAIADVSRRFETASGVFEGVVDKKLRDVVDGVASDLAVQVLDAWRRGSVGTSLVRVTIRGRQPLPVMEEIKEKIRTQVTQVRSIRERLVSSEGVSFELDTVASTTELLAKLESLDISGKKLLRESEGSNELVLKLVQ